MRNFITVMRRMKSTLKRTRRALNNLTINENLTHRYFGETPNHNISYKIHIKHVFLKRLWPSLSTVFNQIKEKCKILKGLDKGKTYQKSTNWYGDRSTFYYIKKQK